MYINDLPLAVTDSSVSMYADDTSLCYQSLGINKLTEVINSDLEKLHKWLMSNRLFLNAMKIQSMLISTKQKHAVLRNLELKLSLKTRDHELEVVDTTNYLGLQIDNSLDWKYHISTFSPNASKAVGFLKHAKSILPFETLNKLCTGIIEPHFCYCRSVWRCCGVTEKHHLQKLQNRGARIITHSSFDAPYIPLVHTLVVFKSIHGLAPQYMSDLFIKMSQLSSYNLHNIATDLWLPQKRSANGLKCFSYRGAKHGRACLPNSSKRQI